MSADISEFVVFTERKLEEYSSTFFSPGSSVADAARYALLGSGKRVRAVLIYLTASLLGRDWRMYRPFACGIEMIHCYSLIHDDLPCMDDDDFRRGKPSCHVAFGEAVALLAGDALLGCGIECVSNAPGFSDADLNRAVRMMTRAMGPRGMIYGQELDLRYEGQKVGLEKLTLMHSNKTGALISLCGALGMLGCEVADTRREALETYFKSIGLVFQIVDDILDVESTTEELGKPAGSDAGNDKSTFVTLLGLEESRRTARQLTSEAEEALVAAFGEDRRSDLLEYTGYLLNRKK